MRKSKEECEVGLEVVCAWCGKREDRAPSRAESPQVELARPQAAQPLVTHVICESCYVREVAQVERIVRGYRRKSSA